MPMTKSKEPSSNPCSVRGLFEIENFCLDFRKRGELLHRAGEEAGGYVGESVRVQAALEAGRTCAVRPPVPAPTSRMRNPRAFGQRARSFLHRGGDGGEPVAGQQTVAIKLIEQIRARAGKEHLHRIFLSPEDRTEFGASSGNESASGR